MIKKINLTILLFLIAFANLYAQTQYFYYYKGKKQYLELDKTRLSITTSNDFQKEGARSADFEMSKLNNDLTSLKLMYSNIKLNLDNKATKIQRSY